MTDQVNLREIVLDLLLEVIEEHKYSHKVLGQKLKANQQLDQQERAFITRLFNGTVKAYLTLDYVIDQYSTLPVRKMKPLIRNLLRMSAYQLMYMDQVPASAVCNEAVKLAKKRGFVKLSGFVNAVIRNIARGDKMIEFPDKVTHPLSYLSIRYSFPEWLTNLLLQQYDFDTVEAVLRASLQDKETTIRTNLNKITPQDLAEMLRMNGVTVEESGYLDYAFKIKNYDYLEKLEAFQKGFFAVQDISSMLVCEQAGIEKGDSVIDVCAAPGGKALHAAQTAARVLARDLTSYKTNLIEENIKRLGADNVETEVWDATMPDPDQEGRADIVIADLPCSGMGVFGKKADIKYQLTKEQCDDLVKLQRTILSVVQSYVKKGGILIFSTCTINKEENLGNREWFLQNFGFEPVSLEDSLAPGLQSVTAKEGYLQLIQGIHNTDGFFISKFRKLEE